MARLICGIGYNSGGKHKALKGGKHTKAYRAWNGMFTRCYRHRDENTSYVGCSVAREWHDFQVFAEWLSNQSKSSLEYAIDKDILVSGNKVYSPQTCALVPLEINNLLVFRDSCRGELPQGVSLNKNKKRFIAHVRINSKSKHLGVFDCPQEAHQAYRVAKEAYVKEKALEWQDRIADNVFQALMNWELV